MTKRELYNLGMVLGLSAVKLQDMMDSRTFRDDMVASWLRKEDQVLQRYPPTWRNLVVALQNPRVGQNGIAATITKERLK